MEGEVTLFIGDSVLFQGLRAEGHILVGGVEDLEGTVDGPLE